MGNAHSSPIPTRTSGALDSFVAELGPDIAYEKSIGSSRFLKSVKCRHRNGYLMVKIFIKADPSLSLRNYHQRLKVEREALVDLPNVYNYQCIGETDRAGYIVRQWIASNLYDRISTRPFLSNIDKKWIFFQILCALRDARNRKTSHGDIKSSNILVTSWNWVYVSDFASFKPTYLPLDDPSDFSFFFDTSGRRVCYVAPERFYTAAANPDINARKPTNVMIDAELGLGGSKRDDRVTEAMDVFSVGCVAAELFLEGAPLFTLSQLFKYREGEFNVDQALGGIEDVNVRTVIKQMIALDAADRPTFDMLLHTSRGTVFPDSFYSFLHNYVSSINELPSPSPFSLTAPQSAIGVGNNPTSAAPLTGPGPRTNPQTGVSIGGIGAGGRGPDIEALPSDSDQRIERIWADYESIELYLQVPDQDGEEPPITMTSNQWEDNTQLRSFQDVFPVELNIPNRESKLKGALPTRFRAASEDGPASIILALVSANIRNCVLPSSKTRALDLFLALAGHLTDEAKLDRMVPYIIDLLHDDSAIVKAAAIRTLMQALMLVTVVTPSNAAIFPEYIIPNAKDLVHDLEMSVRSTYAQCIAPLADTALRYLELGQALKAHGAYKLLPDQEEYGGAHYEMSYDASLQDLQNNIQDQLSTLLVDPSNVVKRSVLRHISSLCIFLGRQKTNDVLLSHMITYLNDREWLLRYAFFDSVVDVAACAGGRSLEEYILPLMIQAMSDVEESVVAKVITSLTNLCELGLFQKIRIWELMSATLGFLYHPNIWIRQAAAAFISSAAKNLPSSDVWCILYPSLRQFLKSDVEHVNEQSLLIGLKPPLPRQILDAAVHWAMRADKSYFWKGGRRANAKVEPPQDNVMSSRKTGNTGTRNKSEEDEAQLKKLQELGMTAGEETKLLAMRDYVLKLANAVSSSSSRLTSDVEDGKNLKTVTDVELQKLGVVPQTVFLKPRAGNLTRDSTRQSTRRSILDIRGQASSHGTRANRNGSTDYNSSGARFEDLRRRLATINGSATSLAQSSRGSLASPPLSVPPTATTSQTVKMERPSSPTESVVSTANSSALLAQRIQVGSTDGQKAAPAVGSSKASATGLLEASSRIRSDGSPERSGRSSPVSIAGTLRGANRSRVPPTLPIPIYDGQEPGISLILENLYMDNTRELQQDFGPKVREGPVRRRSVVRQSFLPRDGSARRLEANVIAHLTSHSDSITGLAVSPDHMFFVSCSDDKTVKVWDTARLERNVTSKPRHTYGQHHARVKCVCILEGMHCFASAAEDGSLHVVRVHVSQSGALPKYNKLQVIREHRVDHAGEYITCMSHYMTDTSSNLVYATTHSMIVTLDLRTMRVVQTMENPRHHGPITCMFIDRRRAWLVVGTSIGILSLWDRRFGLLLRSWKCAAAAAGKPAHIRQCIVHPSKGRGKWILVAAHASEGSIYDGLHTLIEVWDVERGILVESFATRTSTSSSDASEEPREIASVNADDNAAAAIAALVRSRQTPGPRRFSQSSLINDSTAPPSINICAMIGGLEFGGFSVQRGDLADTVTDVARSPGRGFVLTGSMDRKMRLWDLGKLERTTVLSGLESEHDKPSFSTVRASNGEASIYLETCPPQNGMANQNSRPTQRMSLIANNQQSLLKTHQDVITALACIDSPFRGGIVSGDRRGVLKVFRMEM